MDEIVVHKSRALGPSTLDTAREYRAMMHELAMRHLRAWHHREFGDRTATRLGADARANRTP